MTLVTRKRRPEVAPIRRTSATLITNGGIVKVCNHMRPGKARLQLAPGAEEGLKR